MTSYLNEEPRNNHSAVSCRFRWAFVEFFFVLSRRKVELGALVDALVFRRTFYRFILLKVGDGIVALDCDSVRIYRNFRFFRFSENRESMADRSLRLSN